MEKMAFCLHELNSSTSASDSHNHCAATQLIHFFISLNGRIIQILAFVIGKKEV